MALSHFLETIADVLMPTEVHISPDGRTAAYVLGAANKPDEHTPHQKAIWLVDTATGEEIRVEGTERDTNSAPCWSPLGDGTLAFVSNRANATEAQIYLRDAVGSVTPLTDLRGTVDQPAWSPDGNRIAFLYEGTSGAKPREADPVVVDALPIFRRVWTVDVVSRALKQITPDGYHIFEYAWSPDGTRLAVLASNHPNPAESWYTAQIFTVDVANGAMQPVCAMKNQIGRLAWSPDSDFIAFVSGVLSDQGNVSGDVYKVTAAGGEARCLTPQLDHSVTWIEWRERGILYGGRHIECALIGWIDAETGATQTIAKGSYAINGVGTQYISVAADGTFAAIRESFSDVPNIYIGHLDTGEMRPLTRLASALPVLRVEDVHWTAKDGTPVHGFLVYPRDYQSGKRYPLFAHVHGGPSWSYVPRYVTPWGRILSERGCFVLMPNPRGSWGRGNAFQAANVGDLGGGDWQDVEAGIDHVIASGLADSERLAVGGWSYAGYLTAWAVTQTDRFRCAIAGAAITSYESNYGVVPNREWQTTLFGSNVYDDYDLHRSRSPIAHVKRVKTPTLLVHGMLDLDVPYQQAVEFYTALKHFGVPSQLVLYPREPHGFQERAHQIDLYERIGAWVDQYLMG